MITAALLLDLAARLQEEPDDKNRVKALKNETVNWASSIANNGNPHKFFAIKLELAVHKLDEASNDQVTETAKKVENVLTYYNLFLMLKITDGTTVDDQIFKEKLEECDLVSLNSYLVKQQLSVGQVDQLISWAFYYEKVSDIDLGLITYYYQDLQIETRRVIDQWFDVKAGQIWKNIADGLLRIQKDLTGKEHIFPFSGLTLRKEDLADLLSATGKLIQVKNRVNLRQKWKEFLEALKSGNYEEVEDLLQTVCDMVNPCDQASLDEAIKARDVDAINAILSEAELTKATIQSLVTIAHREGWLHEISIILASEHMNLVQDDMVSAVESCVMEESKKQWADIAAQVELIQRHFSGKKEETSTPNDADHERLIHQFVKEIDASLRQSENLPPKLGNYWAAFKIALQLKDFADMYAYIDQILPIILRPTAPPPPSPVAVDDEKGGESEEEYYYFEFPTDDRKSDPPIDQMKEAIRHNDVNTLRTLLEDHGFYLSPEQFKTLVQMAAGKSDCLNKIFDHAACPAELIF